MFDLAYLGFEPASCSISRIFVWERSKAKMVNEGGGRDHWAIWTRIGKSSLFTNFIDAKIASQDLAISTLNPQGKKHFTYSLQATLSCLTKRRRRSRSLEDSPLPGYKWLLRWHHQRPKDSRHRAKLLPTSMKNAVRGSRGIDSTRF